MSGTARKANISPEDVDRRYRHLFAPHIDSFNWFLEHGLRLAIEDLDAVSFQLPDGQRCSLWVEEILLHSPYRKTPDEKLKPKECRASYTTYGSEMIATIGYQVGGELVGQTRVSLGRLPVMVRSNICNLHQHISVRQADPSSKRKSAATEATTAKERCELLIGAGEEPYEQGGFFIVNGIEKLCRMINLPRRNYPFAYIRDAYEQSGSVFTSYVVQMRSTRRDHTGETINLHYLKTGDVVARFVVESVSYFIPAGLLLKAWRSSSDLEIYHAIVQADGDDTWLTDRVECLLRAIPPPLPEDGPPHHKETILRQIGRAFKGSIQYPDHFTLVDIGKYVLDNYVLVHLDNPEDKFNTLVFMIRKLYAVVAGKVKADNADSVCNQEVLMPGHLYTMVFKEKVQSWLQSVKALIESDSKTRQARANSQTGRETKRGRIKTDKGDPLDIGNVEAYLLEWMKKANSVAKRMEYFLATGNIKSNVGRDLRQMSGFCIVAERLNLLRYISHFRAVHRGQAYQEMKTTSVRKLLPDSWGFVCPVHTPDGGPCGLLNHLSASCELTLDINMNIDLFSSLLNSLGMISVAAAQKLADHLPVYLDGRVLGFIPLIQADEIENVLRALKILGNEGKHLLKDRFKHDIREAVPEKMEIVLIKNMELGLFPALYLFAGPARMMRPVINLKWNRVEYIGTWEQPFMHIEIPLKAKYRPDAEYIKTKTKEPFTHREISPTSILSVVASLTPFSDFNQSPRNMYQCQMGKQTMGMCPHALVHRADNKIYRLLTPQSPVCRTAAQDQFQIDDYGTGTNAVVAVLSYTGYDMEDAMVINKSAFERGIAWGYVYKAVLIDLTENVEKADSKHVYFWNWVADKSTEHEPQLDIDGLPQPGDILRAGEPYYCFYNEAKQRFHVERYKGDEAIVESVMAVGTSDIASDPPKAFQKVVIKLRIKRFPIRGDKFSSRHGQKGVLSRLYPSIDMPFSDSGITPDIIINPNAFPSRMTIGMLIETMAGKAGCLHGTFYDASPFIFDEKLSPVQYFGEHLRAAGFNYYGNEQLYSGFTGEPLYADIYIGVCFYQRLRHMVGDKYQVRGGEGPSVATTGQPVKGRKVGGGIRFGEMERDSILAHGIAYTLKDRLLNSSDEWMSRVCSKCGSILSVWPSGEVSSRHFWALSQEAEDDTTEESPFGSERRRKAQEKIPPDRCRVCGPKATERDIKTLIIPQVFYFLVTELLSCNVSTTIHTS